MYSSPAIPYGNAVVRLGLFLIVAHTLSALSVSLEWARTDYLTGLVNRRGFHDLAIKELHQSRRNGRGDSLAYLDIDDFKLVKTSWDTMLETPCYASWVTRYGKQPERATLWRAPAVTNSQSG